MRPIKFRAWDKQDSKMYDVAVISWQDSEIQIWETDQDVFGIPLDERIVLMQFTGLHDKNGKEIYEGDILADRQHGTDKFLNFFAVEWGDAGFDPFTDSPENCGCCGGGKNPEYYEVVGNIYSNPELLEKNK